MNHAKIHVNTLDTISNDLLGKLNEVAIKQKTIHFDANQQVVGHINAPDGVTFKNVDMATAKNKGGFNILDILGGSYTNGNITATNVTLNGYLNIIGWGHFYTGQCGKINYQGKISDNSQHKISQKGKNGNKEISKVVDKFTKKYQNTIDSHTKIIVEKNMSTVSANYDFRNDRTNIILVLKDNNISNFIIKLGRHQNILVVAEKCNFNLHINTDNCSNTEIKKIYNTCTKLGFTLKSVDTSLCPGCPGCPRSNNIIFYLIIFVLVAAIVAQFFFNRKK